MPAYYAGVSTVLFDEPALPRMLRWNPDAEYDRPDWRWLSAELVRSERADGVAVAPEEQQWVNRKLDPIVSTHVLPFMSEWNDNLGAELRTILMEKYPGIFWARSVFYNDFVTRYMVEAMLLGGASPFEVAGQVKTDPNYVWYYGKLFFDVADRLVDEKWIESKVIVPAILNCPTQYHRQGILWKLIAIMFGWQVFSDSVVTWRQVNPQVIAAVRALIHDRNNENALIVELSRRINRFSEGRIKEENLRQVELDLKLKQIENAADEPVGALGEVVAPIIQMLSKAVAMPPVRELTAEELQDDPDLALFKERDHDAVEQARKQSRAPRVEELSDEP